MKCIFPLSLAGLTLGLVYFNDHSVEDVQSTAEEGTDASTSSPSDEFFDANDRDWSGVLNGYAVHPMVAADGRRYAPGSLRGRTASADGDDASEMGGERPSAEAGDAMWRTDDVGAREAADDGRPAEPGRPMTARSNEDEGASGPDGGSSPPPAEDGLVPPRVARSDPRLGAPRTREQLRKVAVTTFW